MPDPRIQSEPQMESVADPPPTEPQAPVTDDGEVFAGRRRRRGIFRRLADRAKAAGERAVHSAIDRLIGPKVEPPAEAAADVEALAKPAESPAEAQRRLG